MLKKIISPKFKENMGRFFNRTVDIEASTTARGDYGEEIKTWTAKHQAVPCRVAAKQEGEIRRPDSTIVIATHEIVLDDNYDATEADRIKLDGQAYEIVLVREDSAGVLTYLDVRRVQSG